MDVSLPLRPLTGQRRLITVSSFTLGRHWGLPQIFVWTRGCAIGFLKRRDKRVLTAIVQQKYRRMGDRLMAAVDLTDQEHRPENASEELCRAAIDQISGQMEKLFLQ